VDIKRNAYYVTKNNTKKKKKKKKKKKELWLRTCEFFLDASVDVGVFVVSYKLGIVRDKESKVVKLRSVQ
jgi:hypothetical protein